VTTVALQVPVIRRILNDDPLEIHLNGAISGTTEETVVVDSTDISKVSVGQTWEHDTGGELRRVISTDQDAFSFEAYRGYRGSTAASSHADNSFMYLDPRFPYDTISQAINQCLDYDLFPHIYEIQEHEYTSSTTTTAYNASSTSCEKILDVYQVVSSNDVPTRRGITYTVYPQNVDTDLWVNGLMFEIQGGMRDGTEKYYVNCAHRLAIGTLLSRQERLVQTCAARYLLEWTSPRRLAGPTSQGDRSVRPADALQSAAYFGDEFRRMLRNESKYLKSRTPNRKVFVRGTTTYAHTD
jgi:hypothetical protein